MRILTSEARRIIKGHLNHGLHVGREEAREPPYMVPSVRQDQYSAVRNPLANMSSPPDYSTSISGVPYVETLQRSSCSVSPAVLEYVSEPGIRQGGAWYGMRG